MSEAQRFYTEFKDLILECDKILAKEYELKSKTKSISYFFNCKVLREDVQDVIQIKLENEKGTKWLSFCCLFSLNEHKDFEFQLEAQKKNPKLKLEDAPPKKCILLTEGEWHEPMHYGKDISDWRPSDFLSYEENVLEKRYFLKDKDEAVSFFTSHLKKVVKEDW